MLASRYPEAEAAFRHALALDPDNVNAKYQYSVSLLLATGDVARSLAAAQGGAPQLRLWRAKLLTSSASTPQAFALLAGIPDTPDNFPFAYGSKAQHAGRSVPADGRRRPRPAAVQQALPHRPRPARGPGRQRQQ